jgi:hypothetical protein
MTPLCRQPEQREIRLMEFQRCDFLSSMERKIYLRNMVEFNDEVAPDPVDPWVRS